MKSKFTTSLALVAVLLTGTAAAAVNTQALNGPTESALSTGSTTLLPVTESVAIPGQTEITSVVPSETPTASQTQNQNAVPSPSQMVVGPTTKVASPVTNRSSTSITSVPNKPSVVFANPNPTNGDDEDEDDEDDENEDEDDD